jgi:glutathione S-transferase
MALSIGNVEFDDIRRSSPAEDDLTANLGRLPVLVTADGAVVGQSVAIWYYAASVSGLLGDSPADAARVLSVVEHLKEVGTAFRNLVPWGQEPTAEALNKWFDEGATDATGPADGSARSTRFLKWWMGRIEASLDNNGFAVGNKLSFADVMLYYILCDSLRVEEAAPDTPAWKREVFCSKERTDALINAHPKIKASVEAAAANPGLQKWLANRGVQGF